MKNLEAIFKGLSYPTRLRVLQMLVSGEQCVCKIQNKIDISQNLLSHHLAALRESGLVNTRKEGKWIYYSINTKVVKSLHDYLKKYLKAKSGSSPC